MALPSSPPTRLGAAIQPRDMACALRTATKAIPVDAPTPPYPGEQLAAPPTTPPTTISICGATGGAACYVQLSCLFSAMRRTSHYVALATNACDCKAQAGATLRTSASAGRPCKLYMQGHNWVCIFKSHSCGRLSMQREARHANFAPGLACVHPAAHQARLCSSRRMCARRSRWRRLRRSCRGGGCASLATATPYVPGAGTGAGTYEGGKISGGGHNTGGGGDCAEPPHHVSLLPGSAASAECVIQHLWRLNPWVTSACIAVTCRLLGRICWHLRRGSQSYSL